jgi:hypothetical protein
MNRTAIRQQHIHDLAWLVHLGRPFPATAKNMQDLAGKWGFDKHVRNLLARFPADEKFESGDDFLARCEELDFLAKEEASMPKENLRSSED